MVGTQIARIERNFWGTQSQKSLSTELVANGYPEIPACLDRRPSWNWSSPIPNPQPLTEAA